MVVKLFRRKVFRGFTGLKNVKVLVLVQPVLTALGMEESFAFLDSAKNL